ncbi:hypothetical protein DICVIV_03983 [Dictyocaulus viviparus]|uniref:Uncharacterized protein n=1 Tax=Dictyocaulus viviparus TaxID=29172 RepID=A0A0D8Y149_DICVI|nr:hypothetical protein DICVIV_03983 [Dictyocaulus viviparus]
MLCHKVRRVLSTATFTSGMLPPSDERLRYPVELDKPIKSNADFSLFPSPRIIVPTFELTKRLGSFVSQAIYQLFYESSFDRERFVHAANEGLSLLGECVANGEWGRMELIATKSLVERAEMARKNFSADQLDLLRFQPHDVALSFLHSSFISLRNFNRKCDHGIVCVYFTIVSFIRLNDSVPYEVTMSQLLNDFTSSVLVSNVTFARNLSPLGQWRATNVNYFVVGAIGRKYQCNT